MEEWGWGVVEWWSQTCSRSRPIYPTTPPHDHTTTLLLPRSPLFYSPLFPARSRLCSSVRRGAATRAASDTKGATRGRKRPGNPARRTSPLGSPAARRPRRRTWAARRLRRAGGQRHEPPAAITSRRLTKRSDPGATLPRSGEDDGGEGVRDRRLGAEAANVGDGSGGDLDPDIIGFGSGTGIAAVAVSGDLAADLETDGTSDEMASGARPTKRNPDEVGQIGGSKRIKGTVVESPTTFTPPPTAKAPPPPPTPPPAATTRSPARSASAKRPAKTSACRRRATRRACRRRTIRGTRRTLLTKDDRLTLGASALNPEPTGEAMISLLAPSAPRAAGHILCVRPNSRFAGSLASRVLVRGSCCGNWRANGSPRRALR